MPTIKDFILLHKNKIIIILIILVVAGVVVFFFSKNRTQNNGQNNELNTKQEELAPSFKIHIKPAPNLNDTDNDGLTDEEEKKLGTDAKSSDTDGDGLSDYNEIYKTKTDPKKYDTDGDGFPDGLEVMTGYNPLGAGKK